MQLAEAVRRIKEYDGLQRIIVCTNSNLIAPKNYESVGFKLYNRKRIIQKVHIQELICIIV